jgi:hypothetical protein
MTPARLAECIAILGWTQRETGRQLSRQEAAIRQYLTGKVRIPDADAAWIERLARFRERHPPPPRREVMCKFMRDFIYAPNDGHEPPHPTGG